MTAQRGYVASTSELLSVAESIGRDWERVGVSGQLLARNIDTGEEFGFDVDQLVPLASVVKVPIALTVLQLIAEGSLDGAEPVTVDPGTKSLGRTGMAAFRYPATVAIGDLVLQMLAVSDNAAADLLLERVGIDRVNEDVRAWGCPAIRIRHKMQRMYECAAGAAGGDFALALDLAIQSDANRPARDRDPRPGLRQRGERPGTRRSSSSVSGLTGSPNRRRRPSCAGSCRCRSSPSVCRATCKSTRFG